MTTDAAGANAVDGADANAPSLLLDLANSRLVYDDHVEDELETDAAASAWLVAHGGTGDDDEIRDARAVRPILTRFLRGQAWLDELSPWTDAITRRPAFDGGGAQWRDEFDPTRRIGARAMLEWAGLQGAQGSRIRPCAASDCQHFFIDTSRANTRQWHSMETCGNRAKARRHYARTHRP
ncbi:CGNR zinc finger domain-containing protein [Agromyces aurantiacus]|uniref:CGNR zinc finger domain-containing protein n=1 Tax=Agromyces aurantiacus TaxID=165814 RepID=A0ABV9R4W3_9MICO|nr:CGNR zinc finger domain-containing protein [Agromyces aurantiacus]MBM7503709.1 putative RNA-binding Zn ribbon-like protein [Agromyces aurantiacus]